MTTIRNDLESKLPVSPAAPLDESKTTSIEQIRKILKDELKGKLGIEVTTRTLTRPFTTEESLLLSQMLLMENYADMANTIGVYYERLKEIDLSVRWYKRGTEWEGGSAYAFNNMAGCYYHGYGVEKNLYKACELYVKSFHLGIEQKVETKEIINSIIRISKKDETQNKKAAHLACIELIGIFRQLCIQKESQFEWSLNEMCVILSRINSTFDYEELKDKLCKELTHLTEFFHSSLYTSRAKTSLTGIDMTILGHVYLGVNDPEAMGWYEKGMKEKVLNAYYGLAKCYIDNVDKKNDPFRFEKSVTVLQEAVRIKKEDSFNKDVISLLKNIIARTDAAEEKTSITLQRGMYCANLFLYELYSKEKESERASCFMQSAIILTQLSECSDDILNHTIDSPHKTALKLLMGWGVKANPYKAWELFVDSAALSLRENTFENKILTARLYFFAREACVNIIKIGKKDEIKIYLERTISLTHSISQCLQEMDVYSSSMNNFIFEQVKHVGQVDIYIQYISTIKKCHTLNKKNEVNLTLLRAVKDHLMTLSAEFIAAKTAVLQTLVEVGISGEALIACREEEFKLTKDDDNKLDLEIALAKTQQEDGLNEEALARYTNILRRATLSGHITMIVDRLSQLYRPYYGTGKQKTIENALIELYSRGIRKEEKEDKHLDLSVGLKSQLLDLATKWINLPATRPLSDDAFKHVLMNIFLWNPSAHGFIEFVLHSIKDSDLQRRGREVYECALKNPQNLLVLLKKAREKTAEDKRDYAAYVEQSLNAATDLSIFTNDDLGGMIAEKYEFKNTLADAVCDKIVYSNRTDDEKLILNEIKSFLITNNDASSSAKDEIDDIKSVPKWMIQPNITATEIQDKLSRVIYDMGAYCHYTKHDEREALRYFELAQVFQRGKFYFYCMAERARVMSVSKTFSNRLIEVELFERVLFEFVDKDERSCKSIFNRLVFIMSTEFSANESKEVAHSGKGVAYKALIVILRYFSTRGYQDISRLKEAMQYLNYIHSHLQSSYPFLIEHHLKIDFYRELASLKNAIEKFSSTELVCDAYKLYKDIISFFYRSDPDLNKKTVECLIKKALLLNDTKNNSEFKTALSKMENNFEMKVFSNEGMFKSVCYYMENKQDSLVFIARQQDLLGLFYLARSLKERKKNPLPALCVSGTLFLFLQMIRKEEKSYGDLSVEQLQMIEDQMRHYINSMKLISPLLCNAFLSPCEELLNWYKTKWKMGNRINVTTLMYCLSSNYPDSVINTYVHHMADAYGRLLDKSLDPFIKVDIDVNQLKEWRDAQSKLISPSSTASILRDTNAPSSVAPAAEGMESGGLYPSVAPNASQSFNYTPFGYLTGYRTVPTAPPPPYELDGERKEGQPPQVGARSSRA